MEQKNRGEEKLTQKEENNNGEKAPYLSEFDATVCGQDGKTFPMAPVVVPKPKKAKRNAYRSTSNRLMVFVEHLMFYNFRTFTHLS
jgi:hypothetical protein